MNETDLNPKAEANEWWKSDPIITERIKYEPLEVREVKTFDKTTELLNYTSEEFSPTEVKEIHDALSAVATFTGGKAFDRIKGIAFCPRSAFVEKDKEREPSDGKDVEIAGFFNAYAPVVMMNLEAIREPQTPDIEERYQRFIEKRFHGTFRPTRLQFFIAHEIGHAMDLAYMSEIKKHIDNPDKEDPHWMGFKTSDGEDIVTKNFDAFENPDPTVFLLEPSLSARARLNASEDFAETFAIAALGGEVTSVPRKLQKMAETIRLAKGQEVIGPHKVEIK